MKRIFLFLFYFTIFIKIATYSFGLNDNSFYGKISKDCISNDKKISVKEHITYKKLKDGGIHGKCVCRHLAAANIIMMMKKYHSQYLKNNDIDIISIIQEIINFENNNPDNKNFWTIFSEVLCSQAGLKVDYIKFNKDNDYRL